MGILAGLFSAIYGVQASAARSVRYARDLQQAALLARDKMLEIEWTLKKQGFSVADMTMEGDFDEADAPRFAWRAEVRRVKAEAFTQAMPASADPANPMAAAFAPALQIIGRQLADQVREVRLWVTWKDGGYDEGFDVVTHIVQLNPPTALGGAVGGNPIGPGGTNLLQNMSKPGETGSSKGSAK